MKIKRFLSFALTICLAVAVFAAFSGRTAKVSADYVTYYKLAGYEYELEYLLKDAGLTKAEGKESYTADRTVKYRLIKDGDTEIAADTEEYPESTEITASSTVKFKRAGATYLFTVIGADELVERSFYVKTQIDFDEANISFVADTSAYSAAVKDYVKDKKTGDSFKFSELENTASVSTITNSPYFDITKTKTIVHYYAPGSSSATTASGASISSVSFTLSKAGTYAFYFTFTDSLNNTTSVDDLVLGDGGFWTDEDEDGEIDYETDHLTVPVFSFDVVNVSNPEIVVGSSPEAFLDLEYSVKCFTITATDYSKQYKLYFIPEDKNGKYDKDSAEFDIENNGDAAYIAAVKGNAALEDVTDILDESAMTFTPTKKGYYYVLLTVYNNSGYSETVMSRAIACTKEYTTIEPEKQFFKYNTTSIVFLSISAVSFIAIIVLLFIKPKEKKELEVKDDEKK